MAGKKVRGIDCKLYFLKTSVGGGVLAADPSTTVPPDPGDYDEVKTVNAVEQGIQGNRVAFETRESEDDETASAGRTRDLTISIYENAGDPLYVRLWDASRATDDASQRIGMAYSNCALDAVPILGTNGNFTVTEESWTETKKDGKLVKFKLAVASHVKDFKKIT